MKTISFNKVTIKKVGKEAKEFKQKMVERLMNNHGFTKEESEQAADICIRAANETARDFGEDVGSED